ncbi:MAG TPA: CoA-binding protein [Syntrophomonadaceae bacterium]|nr:CoA-binding protein [Syntrophomonadaceae bacterium]HRX22095.1 CoA-binding protein [Syntrophomonadaceae bacterium]
MLDQDKKQLLDHAKTIAVVGLSDDPNRPSNRIARYLQNAGFQVIPVNPSLEKVLGEKSYPDLKSVPVPIDIVDIFRRSEEVHKIVNEARELNIPAVWIQVGIECSDDTIEMAKTNNMKLVRDCCIMVEHRRLAN